MVNKTATEQALTRDKGQPSKRLRAEAIGDFYYTSPLAHACVSAGKTEIEFALELLKENDRLYKELVRLVSITIAPLKIPDEKEIR